jgi:hypothetical protein
MYHLIGVILDIQYINGRDFWVNALNLFTQNHLYRIKNMYLKTYNLESKVPFTKFQQSTEQKKKSLKGADQSLFVLYVSRL